MVHGANLCFNRSVSISSIQQRVTVPTHHTQRKAIAQKTKSGAVDGYFHQPSLALLLVTACAADRSSASLSPLFLLLLSPSLGSSNMDSYVTPIGAISKLMAQNKAHLNTP